MSENSTHGSCNGDATEGPVEERLSALEDEVFDAGEETDGESWSKPAVAAAVLAAIVFIGLIGAILHSLLWDTAEGITPAKISSTDTTYTITADGNALLVESTMCVTGLQPDKTYNLSIRAKDESGEPFMEMSGDVLFAASHGCMTMSTTVPNTPEMRYLLDDGLADALEDSVS